MTLAAVIFFSTCCTFCLFGHGLSHRKWPFLECNIEWSRPSYAMPLPQDLCGFSIEPDMWPGWAGNKTHRNDFTYMLLNNLTEKSGVAPRIRVGGGTRDHTIYMPSLKGEPGFYDVFAPVSSVITDTKQLIPEALFAVVGYDYWLCSGNLPEDTAYTCGVNIGAGNASEIIAEVREIEKTFAALIAAGLRSTTSRLAMRQIYGPVIIAPTIGAFGITSLSKSNISMRSTGHLEITGGNTGLRIGRCTGSVNNYLRQISGSLRWRQVDQCNL
ncbi:MAG: glycoside hydrolase family 79 protein [Acidomyces sp. 'richmondensis']|nr:MAG: glycoside hydrolase family 79 protein [Acidomyces sp. 'richmondensis']